MQFHKMTILFIVLFSTACSNSDAATLLPTATVLARIEPTSTTERLTATATSTQRSTDPTTPKAEVLDYKIIYERGDFQIREAFLGRVDTWKWDSFSMPQARIRNVVPSLGLDKHYEKCEEQLRVTGWCTDTVRVAATHGKENQFDLITNSWGMGGHYILRKNGKQIWEGHLYAVTCGPIFWSKQIGDEIAIDYFHVITPGQSVDSILITSGNNVTDVVKTTGYNAASAPCEIQGKLAYFASVYLPWKKFLIFDGKQVGAGYDRVFDQHCCWDGPPIQIACNSEIVDFFAARDNGWYHVQAGNLASLK